MEPTATELNCSSPMVHVPDCAEFEANARPFQTSLECLLDSFEKMDMLEPHMARLLDSMHASMAATVDLYRELMIRVDNVRRLSTIRFPESIREGTAVDDLSMMGEVCAAKKRMYEVDQQLLTLGCTRNDIVSRAIFGGAFTPFIEQNAIDSRVYKDFIVTRESEMASLSGKILHMNNMLSISARKHDLGACEDYRRRIFMLNTELIEMKNRTVAYMANTRSVNSALEGRVYEELMNARMRLMMKLRILQCDGANLGYIPFGST